MCGIVGYIGNKEAMPVLVSGLKNLEYRGYDSAGFAIINKRIIIEKDIGKIDDVQKKINASLLKGFSGLAHCRWATHGNVTKENAHPHADCSNKIAIVHNGIIENYSELKEKLIQKKHVFRSETDTEVIAHLIEEFHKKLGFEDAVKNALKEVKGSYALGVACAEEPGKLIAARNESPLIVGKGKNGMFLASDIPALLEYTNKFIYMHDKEIAVITKDTINIFDLEGKKKSFKISTLNWSKEAAEKGGFKHFMLKEIYEQPRAITETIDERLKNGDVVFEKELNLTDDEILKIDSIKLIGCGTSWHAALVGKFMFEELAKIPTEVEYASEFRYRNPILKPNTIVMAISQSGETADTIAALKEAKKNGAKTISICNVKGSSITRVSDGVVYTRAGPEIGVASTKAFTTQLTVLYLLTILFSKKRKTLNDKQIKDMIYGIRKIPLQIASVLNEDFEVVNCAELYHKRTNSLYLGRGVNFPIALEGALKLKEVSYIHAEGYPAAEMKHGPIALIDEHMPVVFIAPHDIYTYSKILGNIEEVKARGGIVIAIATEGDKEIPKKADHTIFIPKTLYTLSSILAVVPLQLLAYHIADKLGRTIDQPKNLAKVVTVE
ncbi:glutamine--fructose-6-phosphate transaminase (isomerizing) [Candidatus Woesearchaeota archaeon]|nr:glutamine--fructose-6-phosphate transaminase (isomerizing) [Candidatus Woesearchaeota archaeon]